MAARPDWRRADSWCARGTLSDWSSSSRSQQLPPGRASTCQEGRMSSSARGQLTAGGGSRRRRLFHPSDAVSTSRSESPKRKSSGSGGLTERFRRLHFCTIVNSGTTGHMCTDLALRLVRRKAIASCGCWLLHSIPAIKHQVSRKRAGSALEEYFDGRLVGGRAHETVVTPRDLSHRLVVRVALVIKFPTPWFSHVDFLVIFLFVHTLTY
jgi:hypothetical protein